MNNETPDCCDLWAKFWPAFVWTRVGDGPDAMVTRPQIPIPGTGAVNLWLDVNYCPHCGDDRRGVMIRRKTLADALF